MKNLFKTLLVAGALMLTNPIFATAEKAPVSKEKTETIENNAKKQLTNTTPAAPLADEAKNGGLHQTIKEKISEGGIEFMSIVLICLIIGLIISVERVITLSMSSSNVKKLMNNVGTALQQDGVKAAQELCKSTKGPVAGIFAQGFNRIDLGMEAVEKSIENYGGSEMGKLEKGLSWISLFIVLAPMFGFMGTVIGMIAAFDTIETAEEIQIAQVAGGIKTALLTTVAGLIVAVILQVFYNYIVSKIDAISGEMEDATNDFIDLLIVTNQFKK